MKVAIVGAKGLLGEACVRVFSLIDTIDVLAITRAELELKNLTEVEEYISALDFDLCIYTAAISGLEACRENPIDSMKVNALAPELIARVSAEKGAKMVYISTDYVFDGIDDARPDELTKTNPLSAYGKSKKEGERRVMAVNSTSLICRVSWLFGRGRDSFVDQVIATRLKGDEASYINDKFSVPNYCDDLALALRELLILNDEAEATGVLHLTNDASPESWYSFANQVIESVHHMRLTSNKKTLIHGISLIDAHFFREVRPRNTAMRSRRLKDEFDIDLRNWKEGLEEYLRWKGDDYLTND